MKAVVGLLVFALLAPLASAAGAKFDTKYYTVVTDIPRDEAKEAVIRLDRACEQLILDHAFLQVHAPKAGQKLRAVICRAKPDYLRIGGSDKASACYRPSDKALLILFNDKTDWSSVMHEASHQFTWEVLGCGKLPAFFDEGLATYHGYGEFTGDSYLFGRIWKWEQQLYSQHIAQGDYFPLDQLFRMTHEDWHRIYRRELYHHAWSIVHYLRHSTPANRKAYETFLQQVADGAEPARAWAASVTKDNGAFERDWRAYWDVCHGQDNEADFNQRVAALTTLSAVAHLNASHGQRVQNLEQYFRMAQSGQVKLSDTPELWLPPSMLQKTAADHERTAGWELSYTPDGKPTVRVRFRSGALIEARYDKVEQFDTTVLTGPAL